MVQAVGLELKLPLVNDKPAWAPGIDGSIQMTPMDSLIKGDALQAGDYRVVEATTKEEVAAKYEVSSC